MSWTSARAAVLLVGILAMLGSTSCSTVTLTGRRQLTYGQNPPEFMSTHPPDEKRIAAIQQELPEARRAGPEGKPHG
jgi:Zn-dependent protease with chaperone function